MALDEALEAMAGEYVLGTLSPGERPEAQTLLAQDRDFARAVDLWTRRLTPLLLATPGVAPPPELRERILASVGAGDSSANVVALKRRVSFWRGASLAASAIAAALALFILFKPAVQAP